MCETMRSLDSTKKKNNGNRGNVPNLEITEVILLSCNLVNSEQQ